MPHFLILSPDRPGAIDDRLANRQAHLDYWTSMPGVVKVAGAMLQAGKPLGSTFLLEAENEQSARALVAADPFTTQGIFSGDLQIVEVRPAIGEWLPQ